jgi:hypothetical protein
MRNAAAQTVTVAVTAAAEAAAVWGGEMSAG